MGKFDDIINHEYIKSSRRKQMTMVERASQFGAFRAVVGHEDALRETARLTDKKIEPDEYTKIKLNEKLQMLKASENPKDVTITYFVPDDKKSGGAYITKTGFVIQIKEYEKEVVLQDGTKILIDDILDIEGEQFNEG